MEPNQVTAPRGRRSRRPSMNLNLSSISPLTTDSNGGFGDGGERDVRSSYLQASSAPSTPGILSRSSSAHKNYRSFATLTSLTPYNNDNNTDTSAPLAKSKSSSYLVYGGQGSRTPHRRKSVGARDSSEWLSRTGAAVSEETRLSKGQSWLTSRASSTSLVNDSDDEDGGGGGGGGGSDKGSSTKRMRRRTLPEPLPAGAPQEPAFIDDIFQGDYFSDDEDDDEDEELHWSAAGGSVFGAWVDRIMGWSLFDVDEEDEEDERGVSAVNNSSGKRRRLVRRELQQQTEVSVEPKDREDEGWQDAAWIFAIATKVLL